MRAFAGRRVQFHVASTHLLDPRAVVEHRPRPYLYQVDILRLSKVSYGLAAGLVGRPPEETHY